MLHVDCAFAWQNGLVRSPKLTARTYYVDGLQFSILTKTKELIRHGQTLITTYDRCLLPFILRQYRSMVKQRNEVIANEVLLEGWSKVVRVHYRQTCRVGEAQVHDRDLLDRGDGVAVLLHNRERDTVLLVKQPRITATLRGNLSGETIEVCCGLVASENPLETAIREISEELGHQVISLDLLASFFSSPGASLELVHIFFGIYSDETRISGGGGLHHEGEDIEVLEVNTATALKWATDGTIQDARSSLTLQLAMARGKFS